MKKTAFKILNINNLEFSYKDPNEFIKDFNMKNHRLNMNLNLHYEWKIEKNLFGIVTKFTYYSQDNIQLLNLSTLIEFEVNDLSEKLVIHSNKEFEMDEILEANLIGIAISTGRGILFEKTQGTAYSKIIFPAINSRNLVLSKKVKVSSKKAENK